MLRRNEPYAVIALDERDFGAHRRHELSISLTLAFLLSARLRFHFLMSDDVSREVDRAFDQVLAEGKSGRSLGKIRHAGIERDGQSRGDWLAA